MARPADRPRSDRAPVSVHGTGRAGYGATWACRDAGTRIPVVRSTCAWALGLLRHGPSRWLRAQSKIGSEVRLRLSSKKPSVPATSITPSQSLPAASPRGIGETTGPKNDFPCTEMTGVPTS